MVTRSSDDPAVAAVMAVAPATLTVLVIILDLGKSLRKLRWPLIIVKA